jgi:hypothetical protein
VNKVFLIRIFNIILITLVSISPAFTSAADDREITDENYKFTFLIPAEWEKKDVKETADKDAISYSFQKKDLKCSIMLLAFKLNSVKNLDDFIYTMEKDVNLNIPKRSGDYTTTDYNTFDSKSALYNDNQYTEHIYYYRTKLPDAPFNYVYMFRFITTSKYLTPELESEIQKIASSFLPTAQ